MLYYSLTNHQLIASFKEATIKGIAPDKGLYFPASIPNLPDVIKQLHILSNDEIAYRVIQPFIGNEIEPDALKQIISATLSFPLPVVQVADNIFCLELFHGPTLAFKDVGARFLSECLGYFNRSAQKEVTVLVATSGDTGGAVAHGFYKVPGVKVVILYPRGMVSELQEKQLTTLGENISAIEVNADFDTCQAMVKQAFLDTDITMQVQLTSANSINVARWLPQMFYYFIAYKQMLAKGRPVVFSVPSGNFGNICAGIMANAVGLPVEKFVAATNVNDTVPRFLKTGNYEPHPTVKTISNAMDISAPSNFGRIQEIAKQKGLSLSDIMASYPYTDAATLQAVRNVYDNYNYPLDPHGAVAYLGAIDYLKNTGSNANVVFIETAHPVKFDATLKGIYNIPIPERVKDVLNGTRKNTISIAADYGQLKAALLKQ